MTRPTKERLEEIRAAFKFSPELVENELLAEIDALEAELRGKPPLNVQASKTIPQLLDQIDALEKDLALWKFSAKTQREINDNLESLYLGDIDHWRERHAKLRDAALNTTQAFGLGEFDVRIKELSEALKDDAMQKDSPL